MRRAAHIDLNQPAIVAALLAAHCSVQSLAAVGCGVPDLLVWSPYTRELHLLEVKNPERLRGNDPIAQSQRQFMKAWKGPVSIVETVSEALAVVGYDGVPWVDE